jgi:hypothetical protein
MSATPNTYPAHQPEKGAVMASSASPLLLARLGLAEAIVKAARAQRDEAAQRGDAGLLAGCEVELRERRAAAARLRREVEACA